jgi:anti-anti-sigma regulatory factor
MRQLGGNLRLAAAQPGVEKILKLSGFMSILKFYSSVEEALTSFSA